MQEKEGKFSLKYADSAGKSEIGTTWSDKNTKKQAKTVDFRVKTGDF